MNNLYFNTIEPSEKLKNSILNTLRKEERKNAIYKMVLSSVVSLASISMAVIFVMNIIKDAYQSGLSEYLSLIFSDGASLVSYWQTYVLLVTESLPIIPITIVTASILVFVWSINSALELFKGVESVKKFKSVKI